MAKTNINPLVAQTGLIYGSRYYDPSLSFEQPFNRSQQVIQSYESQKRAKKAAAEAKVASYIDQLGASPDLAKIPPKYRDKVNEFLIEKRRAYSKSARIASMYSPGTTAYMDAVSKMNTISTSFQTLSNQFDTFKKMKEEDLSNFEDRIISDGNNMNDVDMLSDILTDKYDLSITENGGISFSNVTTDQLGNSVITIKELNDLPKYFNKDFDSATKILELNKNLFNAGDKFSDAQRKFVSLQVRNILNKGGRETLLSLATDDFIIPGGLGLDPNLLSDQSRHDELFETVVTQYVNMLEESANAGYKNKIARENRQRQRNINSNNNNSDGLTDATRFKINTQKQFAANTKNFANDLVNLMNDQSNNSRYEQAAAMYKNFIAKNNPELASKLLTRGEHYALWKKQYENTETDTSVASYRKFFPKDQFIFINRTGQGRDLGNAGQYTAYEPFTSFDNTTELYRDLLIRAGLDDEIANYFAYNVSGEPANPDEGVLDPR